MNVFGPTRLMLKSLNVALPVESVFCVSVPPNVPLPLLMAMVTGTPLVANGVPLRYCACTTTGANTAPALVVPGGLAVKASW